MLKGGERGGRGGREVSEILADQHSAIWESNNNQINNLKHKKVRKDGSESITIIKRMIPIGTRVLNCG